MPGVSRQELTDERAPLAGQPHAREPPVGGIGPSLHDAIPRGAVDEPRQVSGRHEQRAAQRRKRLAVGTIQACQKVEPRQRDAIFKLAPQLGEHQGMTREEAKPETDRLGRRIRRERGRTLLRPCHGVQAGRIATPSISTSAPGSSSPLTFTRLMAG